MKAKYLIVLPLSILCFAGCSKKSTASSSTSTGFTATKPSVVMAALATGVTKVGSGLSGSVTTSSVNSSSVHSLLSASDCDIHGEPVATTNRSAAAYAGLLTYCKITTDTGDEESVPGVFSGIQDIACMVENASPTYDGAPHSVTLTFDNTCFSAAKLSNMGVTAGTTVRATITASAPAAFNTHYDRGVDITVNVGGNHHYTFGTKVTGNIIEVTYFDEDQDQAHKTGSGAGYLDLTNGILRVESRMDRILCSENSSCGWNRHIRLYATLTMDGLTPKEPKQVEFLYSNTSSATLSAQMSWDGFLVTASGDLSGTGVKPRGFTTGSRANDTQVATIGNWTENPSSTDCFTYTSTAAGTCGAGLGEMTTNLKYVMAVGSGYTLPTDWFTSEAGLSFTSVDADADVP